jgi:hypothetical protein
MRFMMDQYFKDEPMDDLNKMLMTFAAYNAGPDACGSSGVKQRSEASIPISGSTTSKNRRRLGADSVAKR